MASLTVAIMTLSTAAQVAATSASLNVELSSSKTIGNNIDTIVEDIMSLNPMNDAPPALPLTQSQVVENDVANSKSEVEKHKNNVEYDVENGVDKDKLNNDDVAEIQMVLKGGYENPKDTGQHQRYDSNNNKINTKRQLLCDQRCQERNLLRNRLKSLAATAAKYRHQQQHNSRRSGSHPMKLLLLREVIRKDNKDRNANSYDDNDNDEDEVNRSGLYRRLASALVSSSGKPPAKNEEDKDWESSWLRRAKNNGLLAKMIVTASDYDADDTHQQQKNRRRFNYDDKITAAAKVTWGKALSGHSSLRHRGILCDAQCQQLERLRAKLRMRINGGGDTTTIDTSSVFR